MATQQTTIFNQSLNPGSENLSTVFTSGLGFYLIAPASDFEYQIDIYLQVQLSNTLWRQVRLDPFNVSTTQRITLFPQQILELGLPMRLALAPSQSFLLEVILLQNDCQLCTINSKLNEIQEQLNRIEAALEEADNSDVSQVLETLFFLLQ
ncbi:MAG: hypothetical protein AAF652_13745 [Cyanobacteria bacterium P01_C01_bin.72]